MNNTLVRWFSGSVAVLAVFLGGCFCGGGFDPGSAEASLYLTDSATGNPVRSPRFEMMGSSLSPTCMEPDAEDPSLCTSEVIQIRSGAVNYVHVNAAGYREEIVTIDATKTSSVHLAVEMHAAQ